ncbi:hypothetical protein C9439_02185 [archaeon SCG-AAA382B04]|nr:hypothetical protein C9439_02185 [archaeon SCG-AAA382B04]
MRKVNFSIKLIIISIIIAILVLGTCFKFISGDLANVIVVSVLALITAYYALQTKNLVEVSREELKEKRISRRKHAIVDMIVNLIDPLIEQLDRNKNNVKKIKGGEFKKMYTNRGVKWDLLRDLKRDNEGLARKIYRYRDLRKKYSSKREGLEEVIEREAKKIKSSELNEHLEKLYKDKKIGELKDWFEKYFLRELPKWILKNKEEISKGKDQYDTTYNKFSDLWLKIRKEGEVSKKMKELKNIAEEIEKKLGIKDELEELREEDKYIHSITEKEIEEAERKRFELTR